MLKEKVITAITVNETTPVIAAIFPGEVLGTIDPAGHSYESIINNLHNLAVSLNVVKIRTEVLYEPSLVDFRKDLRALAVFYNKGQERLEQFYFAHMLNIRNNWDVLSSAEALFDLALALDDGHGLTSIQQTLRFVK